MSEGGDPVELVLSVRRERDPYTRRMKMVGVLNVHTFRHWDEGTMRATLTEEGVLYQRVEEAMRADVERFLQRSFPYELVARIEHAIRSNLAVPPWEAQELVGKLRAGAFIKVKSVRLPDDRRDEWIDELQGKLTRERMISARLTERLRHEQLRGRLFKKGKKGRVRRG